MKVQENWRRIAERLEKENQRLQREICDLQRERQETIREARKLLGEALLPEEELDLLPEALGEAQELETGLSFWLPEDEDEAEADRLRKELEVVEPTLEQLEYWGDFRDEKDCQVRAVARQALNMLRRLRASRSAPADPRAAD
jgi:ElaB/YqjD/DUF883 family membrane-anchored ribosome-binding protein